MSYHRGKQLKLFSKNLKESARLPGLPVAIDYRLDRSWAGISIVEIAKPVREGVERADTDETALVTHYRQVLIDEDPSRPDEFRYWDGYKVRDAFLAVRSIAEMKVFLSACGPFKALPDALDESGLTPGDMDLTWAEFLRWQQYLRLCMREDASGPIDLITDNEYFAFQGKLRWDLDRLEAGSLQMRVSCDSALEAMAASVFLDKRRGIRRRLCLSVDCDIDFVIPPAGVKLYCSHECSHKAGQRRRRAQARIAKDKGVAPPKV